MHDCWDWTLASERRPGEGVPFLSFPFLSFAFPFIVLSIHSFVRSFVRSLPSFLPLLCLRSFVRSFVRSLSQILVSGVLCVCLQCFTICQHSAATPLKRLVRTCNAMRSTQTATLFLTHSSFVRWFVRWIIVSRNGNTVNGSGRKRVNRRKVLKVERWLACGVRWVSSVGASVTE